MFMLFPLSPHLAGLIVMFRLYGHFCCSLISRINRIETSMAVSIPKNRRKTKPKKKSCLSEAIAKTDKSGSRSGGAEEDGDAHVFDDGDCQFAWWLGNQADQALKSPAPNPPNSKTTIDSGFKSPVQAPFRAPGWEAKVCLIFS